MIITNLVQGSSEWLEHRSKFFNASDAPAMMGESPYKTRDQLLHELATGITPDVSPQLQAIFNEGHRAEALARPLAEEIVGDDLYPVVGTEGKLSASFDGLVMDRVTAFEHKAMNDVLRAAMQPGCTGADLPRVYQIQMEQQTMVSGCERVLFMASKWDGEGALIEERHCWYTPNPELRADIAAGWAQVERDLADYKPPIPAAPKTMAEAIEALPALAVQIEGRVLQTNLPHFREAAERMIATINTDLQTDQDFANAEAMVKFCSEAEKRLAGVKDQALGQTSSIDELFRTLDAISATLRDKRLQLDKLVKSRKEDIRGEIAREAMRSVQAHLNELGSTIGAGWIHMPAITVIVEAMKGKKTVETLRSAANAAAAQAKVEITQKADRMLANHQRLTGDGQQYATLFPDFAAVGDKGPEDFDALLQLRIARRDKEESELMKAKAAAAEAAQTQPAERRNDISIDVPHPAAKAATAAPPTRTEATAVDTIQRIQDAVIEGERVIKDFIASRTWAGGTKEAQFARAIIVEYEKFRAKARMT